MSKHAAGSPAFNGSVLRAAFVASAGAAAIHFGAAHAHLAEYAPAGGFMIVAGVAQAAWALSLIEPTRGLLRLGLAGNAAIVVLWIVSRTIGLPFGMAPWTPEDIHTTDALATALEVVALLSCYAALRPAGLRNARLLSSMALGGVVLSLFASAHEPVWERAVTAATMLLITTLWGVAVAYERVPEASTPGRNNAEVANDLRRRGVLDGGAWPAVGAGGF